jgi:hypothetical protein
MAVPVMGEAGWYMKELMKYPPQFKIGFASNNPPIYDLAPKLEKAQAEHANENNNNHNGNGKNDKNEKNKKEKHEGTVTEMLIAGAGRTD